MTVKIIQKEIDKVTMEQHTYIKYDVCHITTTHDGHGNVMMHFTNKKGQHSSINLNFFKVEIHEF